MHKTLNIYDAENYQACISHGPWRKPSQPWRLHIVRKSDSVGVLDSLFPDYGSALRFLTACGSPDDVWRLTFSWGELVEVA